MSLALTAYTASSAVGHGRAALLDALRAGRSGLKACDFETAALATWMGEVPGVDEVALPPGWPPTIAATTAWRCWACAPMASRTRPAPPSLATAPTAWR